MIYTDASTMILTRNCLALLATEAVKPVGLLQSQVTYVNGCYSIVDLLTGAVAYKSRYRKQPKHNKVNDDPKAYEITPVYFDNQDGESNESLYRHGKVHILNTALSAYHRHLFDAALQRAAIQDYCDISEAKVHIHHIDVNRRNNAIYNLLPVTDKEHIKIHNALRHGASTYDALVAGLGEELVNSIFGADYFDFGDGGVYTAAIKGTSYMHHILTKLSAATLPANTKCLLVKTLHNRYISINIAGMSIYQLLTALYNVRAISIVQ